MVKCINCRNYHVGKDYRKRCRVLSHPLVYRPNAERVCFDYVENTEKLERYLVRKSGKGGRKSGVGGVGWGGGL